MFIGNVINDESNINFGNMSINNKSNQNKQVNQLKDGVINAANLNLGKQQNKQSLVEEKKESFKKQALDTIETARKNREKKLASLEEMQKQCEVLEQEIQEDKTYIEELSKKRTALMEKYGIEADSEEEKELKFKESILFVKKQEEGLEEKLTKGFTDYQKQALDIDKMKKEYTDSLKAKENELVGYQQAIIDFKIDDVKDQSMINVNKEAKRILEEGNKAVINQVVKEAVEKKEEKTKEAQEKAKEAKEEQEIQDKQQEQNIDNEMKGQEDHTEIMTEVSQITSDQAQKKLLKMAQESKLFDEDIKGIAVDEQV